jgi:uncharacterized protein with FMN-binding domain
MKRILLAVTGTVFGLVALLSFKTQSHPLATAPGGLPSSAVTFPGPAGPATPSTSSGSAPPDRSPSSPTSPAASGANAARKYVGTAVQTRYGIVQVAANVSGSRIASVSFVQLTAFDGRSQQINSDAAPLLLQETLKAQSAHIDAVSGATYTSDGYVQSLQSALDQAGLR